MVFPPYPREFSLVTTISTHFKAKSSNLLNQFLSPRPHPSANHKEMNNSVDKSPFIHFVWYALPRTDY